MFINKAKDGLNNVCGKNVAFLRKNMGLSQRQLADALQLAGLDIDKNAVQRIECGKRFVTDIEIIAIADTLGVSLERSAEAGRYIVIKIRAKSVDKVFDLC